MVLRFAEGAEVVVMGRSLKDVESISAADPGSKNLRTFR
jgi:hypothetical protein